MKTTMLATGIRPALNLTRNLNLNLSFAAAGIKIKRKMVNDGFKESDGPGVDGACLL